MSSLPAARSNMPTTTKAQARKSTAAGTTTRLALDNTTRTYPLPSKQIREQVIGSYKASGGDYHAAQIIGCSVRTLSRLYNAHPDFKQEVDEARKWCVEAGIKRLYDMGNNGNVAALIFWLKNNANYSDRREIQATVDVNVLPKLLEASMAIPVEAVVEPRKLKGD